MKSEHGDGEHAEHDPVLDPAPIEDTEEGDGGKHDRLPKAREETREAQRDLAEENDGDPSPADARVGQAPEDHEEGGQPRVGQGEDGLGQQP